jgi:galactose-1-phosphate uridylyltransferase
MDREVAAYFRPSTAAKRVGMFTRTCRVMKREKEKKRILQKKEHGLIVAPFPPGIG